MSEKKEPNVYPYIPNSAPEVRAQMLDFVGAKEVDELFSAIPKAVKLDRKLGLPAPFASEYALKRHVSQILAKNKTCEEYISFLGDGIAYHYVPAVCDEMMNRTEFVTPYFGDALTSRGRVQVMWEFQSLMGDLLEMDVVGTPTYCGASAAYSAILLASRVLDRWEALVPKNISPDTLSLVRETCRAQVDIKQVGFDAATGLMDLNDLRAKISDKTAAVYFENPTYFGCIEAQGKAISQIAQDNGALCVVAVNPISLGVLEVPRNYGADIVCGDMQPLGIHMQYGGGLGGFLAMPDEERFLAEFPHNLIGRTDTVVEGEIGFSGANHGNTSYVKRELSRDFTGTNASLHAVAVGAYLSLMGPQGMREVGETILAKAHYAMKRLATVKGVKLPLASVPFMQFVVNFDGTGKTVAQINKSLLNHGIFGGKDISKEFPEYGQSALYCVTEAITKDNIDSLVDALKEVMA